MNRKYFIFIITLVALICIGFLSGNVYSLGHYKSLGGTGGTVANCNVCHDFVNGRYQNPDATHNLRWVKTTIKVCSTSTDTACSVNADCPAGETCTTVGTVKFDRFSKDDLPAQTPPYDGTLADGNNALLDGACEVCHHPIELFTDSNLNNRWDLGELLTDLNDNGLCDPGETYTDVDHNGKCDPGTKYHNYAGDSPTIDHHNGEDCRACHPHFLDDIVNYFAANFPGNQSHYTHFTDPKGPILGDSNCTYCHYSTSVLNLFKDGNPLSSTNVCDNCHGKGGDYDLDNYGGIADAKANWEIGIYKPPYVPTDWPSELRDGQEFWCLNCHDNVPAVIDTPSTPSTDPVAGPNVAGISAKNYSYFNAGHGRSSPPTQCAGVPGVNGCHFTLTSHIDGNARTYQASSNDYQEGYRLSGSMSIPRSQQEGSAAFDLCTSCHSWTKLMAPMPTSLTNFRNTNTGKQHHEVHIGSYSTVNYCWDSDWDGLGGDEGGDSTMSCPACHNVHGSPMFIGGSFVPSPPMINHGELISSPGTTDKVPALSFRWYDEHDVETADFANSRYGFMIVGSSYNPSNPFDITLNHVCWGCHETQYPKYFRVPSTAEAVTIHNVWTTLTDGAPYPTCSGTNENVFGPGDSIRYHVSFTISGPAASYNVITKGTLQRATGTGPTQTFQITQTLTPGGPYHLCWDKLVPSVTPPLDLKVTFDVGMLDISGTLKQLDSKGHLFHVY